MTKLSSTDQCYFLQNDASDSFIIFLTECYLNVLRGKVPINKKQITKYEKTFRIILDPKTSHTERRKFFCSESFNHNKDCNFMRKLLEIIVECMQKNSF